MPESGQLNSKSLYSDDGINNIVPYPVYDTPSTRSE